MGPEKLPESDRESQVLGFIKEAVQEGDDFLRQQKGYSKIGEAIDAIMGQQDELPSQTLSRTRCNRLGKNASDLAALMTDIKPFWEYRTFNKSFERHSKIFGNLSSAWYPQRQIDMKLSDAIKYVGVAGTGWTHLEWNEFLQDQDVTSEDPRDALPIRPASSSLSIQEAMGIVIRTARPVSFLRRQYPNSASKIKADRDGSWSSSLSNTRAGRLFSDTIGPFWKSMMAQGAVKDIPRVPTADLFTVYLHDYSRNETGGEELIGDFDEQGEPMNNWSYRVAPGQERYPRGRLIVATNYGVLNDGPNIYWHGKFPCPKLTLDPWPWAWLGKAPLWDLLPLQRSLDRILRVVDDHMEKIARPDLIADKNSVSRATLRDMDTRKAGGKYMHNPTAGKGLQLVYPPSLPSEVKWFIEFLIGQMDELSGVRDMSQLMRLNQLPGADTIEKLMESMTASVRGRSRQLEAFIREFAMMVAYNFAQFYTVPMRLAMLGPDGATMEDFDYDPGTLIPDFIHAEDYNQWGAVSAQALARGPMPRYDRTREFMRQFTFHVAPGSLLAASEIERKLIYLQLARAGWIDMETLLEVLGIPNIAQIKERLTADAQAGLGMQASAAGRKATGQTMPRMVVKES